jgi:membrane carboxypeptidase/penicillin-binding protein PbpC
VTPLRLRVFSLISNVVGHALQALALRLLPELSQLIYERTQAILKDCSTDLAWESYENALIHAEDHRFHFHHGVDFFAITRALYQTFVHHCRQGGSTIEQQLVRTLTRDYRRSYNRKIRELLLASTLARNFRKQEVLRAYLSVAYFGTDMVGLPQAIKNISIPAAINGYPEAYLIAHLRYPKPRKTEDHLYRQRLRRAEVTFAISNRPLPPVF